MTVYLNDLYPDTHSIYRISLCLGFISIDRPIHFHSKESLKRHSPGGTRVTLTTVGQEQFYVLSMIFPRWRNNKTGVIIKPLWQFVISIHHWHGNCVLQPLDNCWSRSRTTLLFIMHSAIPLEQSSSTETMHCSRSRNNPNLSELSSVWDSLDWLVSALSLDQSRKTANVVPLLKRGARDEVSNNLCLVFSCQNSLKS